MAAAAGRLAVMKKAGTAICTFKALNISVDHSPIDITDSGNSGVVTLLSNANASSQISMDISGVYTDPTLRNIAFDLSVTKFLTDVTFHFSDALAAKDTIAGNFFVTGYKESNPDDNATDFSCTLVSSGAWTIA